jgi:hypothetical protein
MAGEAIEGARVLAADAERVWPTGGIPGGGAPAASACPPTPRIAATQQVPTRRRARSLMLELLSAAEAGSALPILTIRA